MKILINLFVVSQFLNNAHASSGDASQETAADSPHPLVNKPSENDTESNTADATQKAVPVTDEKPMVLNDPTHDPIDLEAQQAHMSAAPSKDKTFWQKVCEWKKTIVTGVLGGAAVGGTIAGIEATKNAPVPELFNVPDNFTGVAKHYYPDGSEYTATFVDGVRQGHGSMKVMDKWSRHGYNHSHGGWFEGDIENEQRNGEGTMKYIYYERSPGENNGVEPYRGTYTGHWEDDKRHGQGTMIYPDGDRYNGMWADDCPVDMGQVNPNNEPECGRDGLQYHNLYHTPSFREAERKEIQAFLASRDIDDSRRRLRALLREINH